MSIEQAETIEQPKSYDQEMQDDVRSALTEVNSKTPESEPKTPEVKTEPEVKVETKTDDGRARDEQGRFVAKDDKKPETEIKTAEQPKPVDTKAAEVKATEAKPNERPNTGNPPAGWSVAAKGQWDRTPQAVRDEIAKQATGSDDVTELRPYMERAKQHGQSLGQALQAYTGIEDLLRRDIAGGFVHIASNAGLTQHQAGQLFASLAQRFGVVPNPASRETAPNGQDANPQAPDLNQMLAPVLNPLQQRIEQLDGLFRQQTEAQARQRQGAAMSVIEQFRQAPEHRYYDNLEGTVGDLLEKGIVPRTGDYAADLKAAYAMACRMNPEVSEILLNERIEKTRGDHEAREREAALKAKNASKSVTGSPSPGASSAPKRMNGQTYDEDLHNDVMAALREVSARA